MIGFVVGTDIPPPFSPSELIAAWRLDPIVVVACGLPSILYARGLRRVVRAGGTISRGRATAFFAGVALLFLAFASPLDEYSQALLSVHMVQHFLVTMIAAPLIVLGAPIGLAIRASEPRRRRRIVAIVRSRPARKLSHPVLAWTVFVGVQYLIHFSGMFQSALEHPGIHLVEHAMFVTTGLLFWMPVIGVEPSPHRLGFPARLLYLALAVPALGFVGLAIVSARSPLYAWYARLGGPWRGTAAPDQDLAGALMWILGDLALVLSILLTAAAWKRAEDRLVGRARRSRNPATGTRAAALRNARQAAHLSRTG